MIEKGSMVFVFLFFAELLVLFLLSRGVTRNVSSFVYQITKSRKAAISVMAFLFFPGTLLHELSHAISAGLLGVAVGRMEFVPQLHGEKVKLGSVQIAQSDPFRRFLIGAAPFFTGTTILLGTLYLAAQQQWFDNIFITIIIGYVTFEIGNTMFSSSKDMEGTIELLGALFVIAIALYAFGLRLPELNPNSFFEHPLMQTVFQHGALFLLLPLVIDSIVILLLRPYSR